MLFLCSALQNVVMKTDNRDWYQAILPGLEPDVVLYCIDPRVGTPERNYHPFTPHLCEVRGRNISNSSFRRMGAAYTQAGNIGHHRASLQHGCSRPWWPVARASKKSVLSSGACRKLTICNSVVFARSLPIYSEESCVSVAVGEEVGILTTRNSTKMK